MSGILPCRSFQSEKPAVRHVSDKAIITTVLQAEWTTERTTRKLLNQETGDANAKRGNRTGVMSFGPDPGFRGV